jgi:hypothetical protein
VLALLTAPDRAGMDARQLARVERATAQHGNDKVQRWLRPIILHSAPPCIRAFPLLKAY